MRRRKRLLRAQWCHEQQFVAVAVAAALDHSANKKSLLEKEVVKGDAQHLTGPEDSCRGTAGPRTGARAAGAAYGIVLGPRWCSFSGVAVAGGSCR